MTIRSDTIRCDDFLYREVPKTMSAILIKRCIKYSSKIIKLNLNKYYVFSFILQRVKAGDGQT